MSTSILKEGIHAPELNILGTDDKIHKIGDYANKKLILFFYPKDNTPGWVNESVSFKDNLSVLEEHNYVVLGISRDSIKSHNRFIEKRELPFVLLSDEDQKVCTAYEVLKEKKLYGKISMGIERSTFIIDEKGTVEKVFRKVKAKTHVENDVIPYIMKDK